MSDMVASRNVRPKASASALPARSAFTDDEKNDTQPLRTFEQCMADADKGSGEAMLNVGVCYETGRGVAKDRVKALEYFRKSLAAGWAMAGLAIEIVTDEPVEM